MKANRGKGKGKAKEMNKYEKALKVIDKAVDILKEKEWIQGNLAIDNKDNPIYFVESNIGNVKGCCLAGALCLAHTNETNVVMLVNSHIIKF